MNVFFKFSRSWLTAIPALWFVMFATAAYLIRASWFRSDDWGTAQVIWFGMGVFLFSALLSSSIGMWNIILRDRRDQKEWEARNDRANRIWLADLDQRLDRIRRGVSW